MVTQAKIRKAIDQYKAGERPSNLGKVRSWFLMDDRSGEMFPLKAIWALAHNVPARSFKTNVAVSQIRHLPFEIRLVQTVSEPDPSRFGNAVARSIYDSPAARQKRLAQAPPIPNSYYRWAKVFVRNPDVVAEALFQADGKCRFCRTKAPFTRLSDGSPYLEVHHRKPLADGGTDTIDNAIALCPNCHRKAHHG